MSSSTGIPPMLARRPAPVAAKPPEPAVQVKVEDRGWGSAPTKLDPSSVIGKIEHAGERVARPVAKVVALPYQAATRAAEAADNLLMKVVRFFFRTPIE
jgi:hypothetical protein